MTLPVHGPGGSQIEIGNRIRAERAQLGESLPGLERPAWRAAGAVFGEDLDDARRGLGAVQRARRGALDDLHVVDVGGANVVQRARLVVGAAEPVRVVERRPVAAVPLAADTDAVDVDDRLVALGHAHGAAQPDLRALTRHTAGLHHAQARRTRLEQLIHVGRRILDLGKVDLRDAVADLAHARHPGRSGHDDRIELEHARRELRVRGGDRVGPHDQPQRPQLVADREDAEVVRAGGHVEQREPPLRVGPRTEVRPDDRHLGARNGRAARGRGDTALDPPTLGGGELGRGGQAQGDDESTGDAAHERLPVEADLR